MIWFVLGFVYLTVLGVAFPRFREYYYDGPPNMYSEGATFMAALSTVALPLMLPIMTGVRLNNFDLSNFKQGRRDRELAEADHKIALAKRRAEEVEYLERSALK